jgi:hypothetical protein
MLNEYDVFYRVKLTAEIGPIKIRAIDLDSAHKKAGQWMDGNVEINRIERVQNQ